MSQLKYWNGTAWETAVVGAQGPTGDTGATGPSGVIAVTAPITNSGTSTSANIGVDQTALVIAKTQVSGTAVVVADLASASVNFASTAGTAIFATNAGTASYSVTSGTAVYGINAGTAVYATNAGTAVYATNAGTAVYADTAGTAAPSAHASTHASDGSDAVTLAQSQVTGYGTNIFPTPTQASRWLYGFGVIGTFLQVDGQPAFTPMLIGSTTAIDRIAVSVTGAGSAGSLVRLGIYKQKNNGSELELILDAGTVDSSSTGEKEITISETLSPGIYFFLASSQGGAATKPTLRTKRQHSPVPVNATAFGNHVTTTDSVIFTNLTGAFPATTANGVASERLSTYVTVRTA